MSKNKSVLILGASGITGAAIARRMKEEYNITGTYFQNDYDIGTRMLKVNLKNKEELENLFNEINPQVVINCAGGTSISECENNPEEAILLNVDAVESICKLINEYNSKGIFLSTDSIFSGENKTRDYVEEDIATPRTVYGKSKLKGEALVKKYLSDYFILRISLVYGKSPSGIRGADEKVMNTIKRNEKYKAFTDEYRCPTFVDDIAEVVLRLLEGDFKGTFNVCGPVKVSRYDFACGVAKKNGYSKDNVIPVLLSESTDKKIRSPDLGMSCEKIYKTINYKMHYHFNYDNNK
jgi:dTDP-4-dehydrorhamnose reductase